MPKTFEQLKSDEICIYQAFAAHAGITPKEVSALVPTDRIELDDGAALVFLARHYGFDKVEVVQAAHYTTGEFNFDNNAEFIVAITRASAVRVKAGQWKLLDQYGIGGLRDARDLLTDKSLENESWHAIHGKTGAGLAVTWTDVQRIYPAGPNGESLAVCFTRK